MGSIVNKKMPFAMIEEFLISCLLSVSEDMRSVLVESLSSNVNITYATVQRFRHLPWNWRKLSFNSGISLRDKLANLHEPWDFKYLSQSCNLTMAHVLRHTDLPWNWWELSDHLEFRCIMAHPNLPWDYTTLSRRPELRDHHFLQNPDKPWDYSDLSCRVSLRVVFAYPDRPWNWSELTRNGTVTFKEMIEHYDLPWDWPTMSTNPAVTLRDVLEFPDFAWDWVCLSSRMDIQNVPISVLRMMPIVPSFFAYNRHASMHHITLIPELPYHQSYFADIHDIRAKPHEQWNWRSLSRRLLVRDICSDLRLPWDMSELLQNPTMMMSDLDTLRNELTPGMMLFLFKNNFDRQRLDLKRRHMAAFKIQIHWRRIAMDPKHTIGCAIQIQRIQ